MELDDFLENILTLPEDEKAVLILAEIHETDCIEPTLTLLEAFKPDAIAVELRPDILTIRVLDLYRQLLDDPGGDVLTPEDKKHLGNIYGYWSCMVTSRVYAAKKELPLYYLDWEPFCPLHQQDVLSETPLSLPYRELTRCMGQTIDKLFWEGAAAEAYKQVPLRKKREIKMDIKRLLKKKAVEKAPLSKDEERAFVDSHTLYRSHFGMSLRNEYTAMALNALDKKRILYVCGKSHTHPEKELREFNGFTPLQYLVDAPHTFVADMESVCTKEGPPSKLDRFVKSLGDDLWYPKEIKKKESLKLPWDAVRFYCPDCHGN